MTKQRHPNVLKVILKNNDNSIKLEIDTQFFDALVTSSLRLDRDDAEVELGPINNEFRTNSHHHIIPV